MAKIISVLQKVFGDNAGATGITEYGSPATGTPVYSTDAADIQTASWSDGWSAAALAGSEIPTFQDFNAIHYVLSTNISGLQQDGIIDYDATREYYQFSITRKAGTYELYGSLINANIGNALPAQVDDANWQYLGDLAELENNGTVTSIATGIGLTGGPITDTGTIELSADSISQLAKAWINFNGTGVIAIRSSFNIASIVDLGVGGYAINFDTDFLNADYVMTGAISLNTDPPGPYPISLGVNPTTTPPAPGSITVIAAATTSTGIFPTDPDYVYAAFFGDQ